MKRAGACLAIVCLCAAPAEARPSKAADWSEITEPKWVERPTDADLESYFPMLVARLGVEGKVTVACIVDATGGLKDCAIEAETPKDIGIGDSALRLASRYRMEPVEADGKPVAGRTVRIPFRFQMPERPSQANSQPLSAASIALGRQLTGLIGIDYIIAKFDEIALEIERGPIPGVSQSTRAAIAGAGRDAVRVHADEIREVQTRAYAETFSADELAQIVAFETSHAGAFLRATTRDKLVTTLLARNINRRVLEGSGKEFCKTWACEIPDSLLSARSEAAVDNPQWAHEPTEAERRASMPAASRVFHLTGFARLRCTVVDQGPPEACEVEAEAPAGLGYGAAALSMAPLYRLEPASGPSRQTVAIRVKFSPPDLPPGQTFLPQRSDGARVLARTLAKGSGGAADLHQAMARTYARLLPAPQPGVSPTAFEKLKAALEIAVTKGTEGWIEDRAALIAAALSQDEIEQAIRFVESPTGRAWWGRSKSMEQAMAGGLAGVASRITEDVRADFCRDHECPATAR